MKRTQRPRAVDSTARTLADPPCPEGCGRPIHTGPCNGSQQ